MVDVKAYSAIRAIESRYSCRSYKNKALTHEDKSQLLEYMAWHHCPLHNQWHRNDWCWIVGISGCWYIAPMFRKLVIASPFPSLHLQSTRRIKKAASWSRQCREIRLAPTGSVSVGVASYFAE